MENKWKDIIKLFEDELGRKLNGYELFKLGDLTGGTKICTTQYEVIKHKMLIEEWYNTFSQSGVKSWLHVIEKPIFEYKPTLQQLHYQALLDYKNDECSLNVVEWIEKQMNNEK